MQANASNFGSMYVMLAPFPERSPRGLTSELIANELQSALLSEVPDGLIDVVGAPPIDGLGTAGGFRLMLEDRGDNGAQVLQQASQEILTAAEASGSSAGCSPASGPTRPGSRSISTARQLASWDLADRGVRHAADQLRFALCQ